MARFSFGTAGAITWLYAGATAVLTSTFTSVNFNTTADTQETTAGNEVWKAFLPGQAEWDADAEFFLDDGSSTMGTADFLKLAVRNTGVLSIGPLGTATGKSRYGGSCIVTESSMSGAYGASGDPVKISVKFKGVGTPWYNHGSAF